MRVAAAWLTGLMGAVAACSQRPDAAADGASQVALSAGPDAAPAARATRLAPYEVRGLLDPGLNDLVLGAFLAPRGWQLRQALRRRWPRAVPQLSSYAALTSPDGHSTLEFLPEASYRFTDWRNPPPYWNDPVEHPVQPDEHYPLPPLAYLRQLVLPQVGKLLGKSVRFTTLQADSVRPDALPASASAAVTGVLPGGRHLLLLTTLHYQQTRQPGLTSYQWAAFTTLAETDTAVASCLAFGQLAGRSLVLNPAWQHQQQLLFRDGMQLDSVGYLADMRPAGQPRPVPRLVAPPSAARAYQRQVAHRQSDPPEYAGLAARSLAADSASGPVYQLGAGQTLLQRPSLAASRVQWVTLQRCEARRYQPPLPHTLGRRLLRVPPPPPADWQRLIPRHY